MRLRLVTPLSSLWTSIPSQHHMLEPRVQVPRTNLKFSNFRHLVANPVFDGVNFSIPRKVVEKVVSHPIVTTSTIVTPTVEKSNVDFQTMGKKNKRKGKSKSTNGG
nr:hypothetical protein [Tanacetum cinerariifolium]